MKDPQHNAQEILYRYVKGQCTEEEKVWVEEWYKENYDPSFQIDQALAEEHFAEVWNMLDEETRHKNKITFRKIAAIAASVAILLGIGGYFFWRPISISTQQDLVKENRHQLQIGNHAMLTLADGQTIHLDSIAVGDYVTESGIIITKMDDGTLNYVANNNHTNTDATETKYNVITTPRGGQYKVVLPDNSIVWLNAASSLKFPVAFSGNTRMVELIGEGYFEVAHNKSKPFIVTSQNQQTIVKGTKFNITAYAEDHKMVTTLLEGSVLVKAVTNSENTYSNEVMLRPNEQSVIENNTITKSEVEAADAIAWKNGKFMFNNTPLKTVMQQLSRWYDVEVVYLDAVDEITFTGSVSRFNDVEDVLRKISLTESVRFERRERRIMVRR